MLNVERIQIMTNLAGYKEGPGKRDLEICRYYRGDYIGVSLIKNFFLTSIGYVLLLVFVAGYFLDFFLNQIQNINLMILAAEVIIGYIVVIVVYSTITYLVCSIRYERAKKSVQQYYQELGRLEKMYITEGYRNETLQNSRRR